MRASPSLLRPFAQHYDVIYADKDYAKDIATFERLAGGMSLAEKAMLEIGAGTGNHSLRLAPKVGELVSTEIDPDFVEVLRGKLADNSAANIAVYDCRLESLPRFGFDIAAAFFHVLNYIGPSHLETFLDALSRRLKPGAYFIADIWNGSVAMSDPPREEIREKSVGSTRVVQRIRPQMDEARRRVFLNYEIELNSGRQLTRLTERLEVHLWSREELRSMIEHAGFSNVTFWDYRNFPQEAGPESWKLWLRATKT